MNSYGTGGAVLGATTLPATAAAGLWYADRTDLAIVLAIAAVLILSLGLNISAIARFFQNMKNSK